LSPWVSDLIFIAMPGCTLRQGILSATRHKTGPHARQARQQRPADINNRKKTAPDGPEKMDRFYL
jgi:hypothetical protein